MSTPHSSLPPDPFRSHPVKLVAGEEIVVLTEGEARWVNATRDHYLEQTKFTAATDLRDLDRLIVQEFMVYRYTQYLSSGKDYDGFPIEDEVDLRRGIRDLSDQINKVKTAMGMTKAARDEAASSGDVAGFISNLLQRAKIFGVHRETQLTRALVLVNELSALVGAFDRSDAEERNKLGVSSEKDIVDWIRVTMLPEYREIDQHFRDNVQRYWRRDE